MFPRGHVREHEAIHFLNGCDNIEEMDADNRRQLWAKYLVQIAVEMDVTKTKQAIFLSWFENSARVVILTPEMMDPLISRVKQLVESL